MKASGSFKIQEENLDPWLFQAILNENAKNRILTLHRSQCIIAKNTTKEFIIMCLNNLQHINKQERLGRSYGLLSGQFYSALRGTDIIELRLEGP